MARHNPELVAYRRPMWKHRNAFLQAFALTAQEALRELQEIFPLYATIREDVKGECGIVFNEQDKGDVQTTIMTVVRSPLMMYFLLDSRTNIDGSPCPKVDERKSLKSKLMEWADRYNVSPQNWSAANTWFLDRVLLAFDYWYSFPEIDRTQAMINEIYTVHKASAEVPIHIQHSATWMLTDESKRDFKNRIKREIEKIVNDQLDHNCQQWVDHYMQKGFAKPERRQYYTRDMNWLVSYHCLGDDYATVAERSEQDDVDSVRKAITRRAKDICLIVRTNT